MFIRQRKNPSGSISIQIIDKSNGKYKVVETIACVKDKKELEFYLAKAESRLKQLNPNLFDTVEFNNKKHRFIAIKNKEISVVGPDIIFGIKNAEQKWTMPIRNWSLTLSQLAIHFEGRLDDSLNL